MNFNGHYEFYCTNYQDSFIRQVAALVPANVCGVRALSPSSYYYYSYYLLQYCYYNI